MKAVYVKILAVKDNETGDAEINNFLLSVGMWSV